ncbi:unnamed protein product [Phyllotreta striolata]|uniref:Fatty acyl-CoA reductase n=1 Tax=Phyllotreta striolata TaxID=444603 RepID=A0A9N9TV93_PHYSR|nr:unnamed protein product [Phyllotreta striolata]
MSCDVRSFYHNKNVLLTGGTGFLGKMIIEKLLRTCEVEGIYLIVRPKKGLTPEERLKNLFDEPVLNKIRENKSKYFKKLHTLEGNLTKKELGLNEEDKEIIRNKINIVFHCGASLNMDSILGDAIKTNVRGTSELLDLIKNNQNINAFVQISTAYSNCYERAINEKFYDPPVNPEFLIKMSDELDSNILNEISKGLIGKWPNSYVFSKAVAENLLLTKGKNLPVGLFRPAIVTSTVSEPLPGWSDNLYGPLGIILSSYCGILRVVRANGNLKSHTVPGDMCINAIICFAWDISNKWKSSNENYLPPVMNYSAKNTKLLLSVNDYLNMVNKTDFPPFKKAMWYQVLFLIENKFCYITLKFLLHTIPSYLVDSLLIMSARKTRTKNIYMKIERTSDILCYFLLREWEINNDNVAKLWEKLNENDQAIFNFDINSIDLNAYFKDMLTGMKKFILKEDMAKSKLHKQRYKRLTLLHYSLKYSLIGLSMIPIYRSISKLIFQKKR